MDSILSMEGIVQYIESPYIAKSVQSPKSQRIYIIQIILLCIWFFKTMNIPLLKSRLILSNFLTIHNLTYIITIITHTTHLL